MESAAIYSSEVHEVDSGIPMTLFKGFFESRCISCKEGLSEFLFPLPKEVKALYRYQTIAVIGTKVLCDSRLLQEDSEVVIRMAEVCVLRIKNMNKDEFIKYITITA